MVFKMSEVRTLMMSLLVVGAVIGSDTEQDFTVFSLRYVGSFSDISECLASCNAVNCTVAVWDDWGYCFINNADKSGNKNGYVYFRKGDAEKEG